MQKEMCWLPRLGADGTKILHLRMASHEHWRPYTCFPQYAVPDYQVPKGSKGWATYQKLRLEGWILVPSAQATSQGLETVA
ncbi:MAG: hypothetical protein K6T90_21930 [Leptolyngbyaceae cyanobacterium HOT.MB2.61]|jgi:hypothetical protein|nr:hypothetical protein [Leptolyngbyaceae cyanobacterium HOT.MB2.61]